MLNLNKWRGWVHFANLKFTKMTIFCDHRCHCSLPVFIVDNNYAGEWERERAPHLHRIYICPQSVFVQELHNALEMCTSIRVRLKPRGWFCWRGVNLSIVFIRVLSFSFKLSCFDLLCSRLTFLELWIDVMAQQSPGHTAKWPEKVQDECVRALVVLATTVINRQ